MNGVQWFGAACVVGALLWLALDKAQRTISRARFEAWADDTLAVFDEPRPDFVLRTDGVVRLDRWRVQQ